MNRTVAPESAQKQTSPSPVSRKRKKHFRHDTLAGYVFLSPWLLGFFLFVFLPIAASFILAFTKYNILKPPQWIGFANFEKMFFRDFRYWRSVKVTFFYVFTAIPLRLAFAMLCAMLLNTRRRFVSVYRALYYAPSVVGTSVAVAVMWRVVFGKEGLVNYLLAGFGIAGPVWLGDPNVAIWTLIVLAAWQFGSPMLIFLAGLKQIPDALYESASIDGASTWHKIRHITLPMLTPVILFNLVMQMISGFLIFAQAFIVSNGTGTPMDSLLVYALYLYRQAFVTHKMGYSSAMAWVLLVMIAAFTALVFKSSQYWVFYESGEGE
ncbi:MAG: sugar ABC transporter permease [bacterium]|nr:sugar ABC transporter permease [bacterium]